MKMQELKHEITNVIRNDHFWKRKDSNKELIEYIITETDIFFEKGESLDKRIKFIKNELYELYDIHDGNCEALLYKFLVRSDGKINSPLLRNPHIQRLVNYIDGYVKRKFPFLEDISVDDPLEAGFYCIKNEIIKIPKCIQCGNPVKYFYRKKRFCTQLCAVTSNEAKKRTSITHKGKSRTTESIDKMIKSRKINGNLNLTSATKNKISEKLKGNTNFLDENGIPYCKGRKMSQESILKSKEVRRKNGTLNRYGKDHPAFGKSPSPLAGRGISGYYGDNWFRSSLELFYMIFWDENKIEYHTAETNEYMVEYIRPSDGTLHGYHPDFVVEGNLLEIKPHQRTFEQINKIKMEALKAKFGADVCSFATELEIRDFISSINFKDIEKMLNNGKLRLNEKQKLRFEAIFDAVILDYTKRKIN